MPDTIEVENEINDDVRDEVVESEDTQVAEQETAEVEQTETPEDWRDDRVKSIANHFGWNDATIEAMGGKEAFYAAVTAVSQANQQNQFGGEREPAKQDTESESPSLPELPELDLSKFDEDDPSLQLLKQSHESSKQFREFALAQAKELKELKENLGGFTQMQQQQQELAQQAWFDGEVKGVNPDVFGSEDIGKCTASQADARVEAYNRFNMLRQALPHESPKTLFDMVMVGKTTKNDKSSKLREKRAAQVQGGRPPQSQPEDKAAKYDEINRRILGID